MKLLATDTKIKMINHEHHVFFSPIGFSNSLKSLAKNGDAKVDSPPTPAEDGPRITVHDERSLGPLSIVGDVIGMRCSISTESAFFLTVWTKQNVNVCI